MIAHRRPAARRPSGTTVAAGLVLLAVLVFTAVAGWWFATGGRWLIVQTPSMGRSAPVGTLLWVEPVDGTLHVGDVISFHPPGSAATYTHRVHAIAVDGTISTKGDANSAPDPWVLHRTEVTGRVVLRWWAAGWLVRAGPILLVGGLLLVVLVRRFTAVRWKLPAATIGVAVLTTLPIWIYKPLVRAELVLFQHDGHGAARATYVSTGLLPARLTAPGGRAIVLHNGDFGTILASRVSADGRFTATVGPHLSWWMWVLLIVVCFLPALWSAAVGLAPERAAVRGPGAVAAG